MPEHHRLDSLATHAHSRLNTVVIDRTHTLLQRGDTIYRFDSINVRESSEDTRVDTVIIVQRDSIPYPVEVPIEIPAPIPRFYKICTIGFWLLLILIIAIVVVRHRP